MPFTLDDIFLFFVSVLLRDFDSNAFAEMNEAFGKIVAINLQARRILSDIQLFKVKRGLCYLLCACAVIKGVFICLVSLVTHSSIIRPSFQEYSVRSLPSRCLVLELTAMLNFPGFVTIC